VGGLRGNVILGKVFIFGVRKTFRGQELLYRVMGKVNKSSVAVVVIVMVVTEVDSGN
jgi:hypothetical protein